MRSLFKVTEVRRAAFVICLVLFVFAPFLVHAQDATISVPVVRVQPDSVTVKEGDVFNVSVVIENLAANHGMLAVDFVLTWNNTILNALSMEEVMFHAITPQNEWDNIWQIRLTINNTEGSAEDACLWMDIPRAIDGGYCPVNGISGNHTLAIITMEAVGSGSATLLLPYVQVADMSANPLVNVGGLTSEVPNTDYSGNVSLPESPPGPENDSDSFANLTLPSTTTVTQGMVPMSAQIAPSQENVTEIQKQDALEVTDVPFVMLATMSGMFIVLPARARRVQRKH
jgi:hypothetical protein